ncbi:MAG: glycosyltransferase family 4 protein [Gemmatimonadales bacterium]
MSMAVDVLLDARVIERGHTGIARYVHELVAALPAEVRLSALLSNPDSSLAGARETVRVRSHFLSASEQLELPARVAAWRGLTRRRGVFWVPAYNAACLAPGPMVCTVHDANHLAFPEYPSIAHTLYYRGIVRLACERAAAVITVSEFSRREIVDRIGVDPEKVHVIPLAITPRPRPSEEAIAKVRVARNLPGRYVTYVGNFKPHKNLRTLLEAAPQFATEVPLVLIGGTEAELENALPAARGRGAKVMVLRSVSDEELWPLLAGSSAFAFPSLYEGFGLPPLEAMSLSVPTVVSNTTALPEVVGDGALQVNPRDSEALASAINRLVEDEPFARALGEKGRVRACSRTWREVALQTARVLAEAAES